MSTSSRCEACWRALNEKVYESMSVNELAELQLCFSSALKKLAGRQLADTEQRLHQLYFQLQSGKTSPDIQTKLLLVARALATNKLVEANREFAMLLADQWEAHKDWPIGLKRLLSAQ